MAIGAPLLLFLLSHLFFGFFGWHAREIVENSAQWKMLELGEKQKLGQNAALDFVATPAPPVFWVALGFGGGGLAFRRWRRRAGT